MKMGTHYPIRGASPHMGLFDGQMSAYGYANIFLV